MTKFRDRAPRAKTVAAANGFESLPVGNTSPAEKAVPDENRFSRRSILAGLAAAPVAAVGGPLAAVAAPADQPGIAARIAALAGEMSGLLGQLDAGEWTARVSAAQEGVPMWHLYPARLSPRLRAHDALVSLAAAYDEAAPAGADWCAVIVRDGDSVTATAMAGARYECEMVIEFPTLRVSA